MKEKDIYVEDPGELSNEELERQMGNPHEITFWQMHPLVQHCLRIYQMYHPDYVEMKDTDACAWVKNRRPIAQMFLEAYRLKAGGFDFKFLRNMSCHGCWKFRNRQPS